MKIFITGGNGFIGSHLVRRLCEKNHTVVCLLRPTSDISRIESLPFVRAVGDIRDKESLLKGMIGCEAVVHLASLSSWNDINSPRMAEIVVGGSRNVLDASLASGNLRTVYVSSSVAIDGSARPSILNEESPCTLDLKRFSYARAKIAAEELCQNAKAKGLPVVIVNPTEVYGPNDTKLITAANLLDFAKSSPVFICRGGTSIVHVEDVANGIIAALHKGQVGERYILGGDNLHIRDLAKLSLDVLGQNHKRMIEIPTGILSAAGFVASRLRLPFPIHPNVIPYATRYWFMDNTKAKNQLGTTFRDARKTLESTFTWMHDAELLTH